MPTKRRLNIKEEIFNMAKIYKTTGEVIVGDVLIYNKSQIK